MEINTYRQKHLVRGDFKSESHLNRHYWVIKKLYLIGIFT